MNIVRFAETKACNTLLIPVPGTVARRQMHLQFAGLRYEQLIQFLQHAQEVCVIKLRAVTQVRHHGRVAGYHVHDVT
jgi:hypothetical protein